MGEGQSGAFLTYLETKNQSHFSNIFHYINLIDMQAFV